MSKDILVSLKNFFWVREVDNIQGKQAEDEDKEKKVDKTLFRLSKEPNRLERYKCFDEGSSLDWIETSEIIKAGWNKPENEERRRLWNFFYRPFDYENNMAAKQRSLLKEAKKVTEPKSNKLYLLVVPIMGITAYLAWRFFQMQFDHTSFVVASVLFLFIAYHYLAEREYLKHKKDVVELEAELKSLMDQKQAMIDNRMSSEEVEKLFWQDIVKLEKEFIVSFVDKDLEAAKAEGAQYYTDPAIKEYFESRQLERPIYPMIYSWGFLQDPQTLSGDVKRETGLSTLATIIKRNIATWRMLDNGTPIYRIWYIQFLFFQEKVLGSVSFYYDFISKNTYGLKKEKYLYNHMSNYSFNEEALRHMPSLPTIEQLDLPKGFISNICGNEAKTITFSVSSGVNYRCVLADSKINNSLSKWLKDKRKYFEDREKDKEKQLKKENSKAKINIRKLTDEEKQQMFVDNVSKESLMTLLADEAFKELCNRIENRTTQEDILKSIKVAHQMGSEVSVNT